jgi:hypothetical protein
LSRLGGALARFQPWTPREEALLSRAYSSGGAAAAVSALPHRSVVSVMKRAERLGVYRRRRWTGADDEALRDLWDLGLRISAIAKRLDRTRAATYRRAQMIGLPLGVPDGYEYLSAAAVRTGYSTAQLRRILRWAGMRIGNALARPGPTRSGRRMHIVDPLDVDEAVVRWHVTEPVTAAARRLGIGDELLRGRLLRLGLRPPPGKQHWRVTQEQVAAALALPRRGKFPTAGPHRGAAAGAGGSLPGPAAVPAMEREGT